MTRFVFWEDPYQRQLETKVEKVDGSSVILEDTIAYAESGGQESDRATINGKEVVSALLGSSREFISYKLVDSHGLEEGNAVSMEIDWSRRYRLMRLHFACELFLVLINRHFLAKTAELEPEDIDKKIVKVGAHMAEDKARIDFMLGENINKYLEIIQPQFEEVIRSDVPIETGYIDQPARKRYWRIEGLAKIPCGGTHVKKTGEIGPVKFRRKRANKGVERVYIYLD